MTYTNQDLLDLALCGWMEGREAASEVFAVQCCILNRVVAPGFPKTIHDVIYAHNAFSWTRPDDAEYGKRPADNDPTWQNALYTAKNVLEGSDSPVKQALYYANLSFVSADSWFQRHIINDILNHPVIIKIDRLTFFV